MASNKASLTSGADFDVQATRRRNVPSTSPVASAGTSIDNVEADKKDSKVEKVRDKDISRMRTADGHL
jgi:hypothetical protein